MSIQYPKKFRSGVSPVSRDEVHIFRDPPKAIHTRKKERIGDEQIGWNVRGDESRISEAVMNYAKGVNPMVEIDYSGHGAGGSRTHYLSTQSPSNPYKVNSAFRPPLFRQEDLLPLSRLQRPYTYGITNPGVRGGFVDENLEGRIDRQPIESAISVVKVGDYYPAYIAPSAVYVMGAAQEVDPSYAVHEDGRNRSTRFSSVYSGDKREYGMEYFSDGKYTGFLNEDVKKGGQASSAVSKKEGFTEHTIVDFDTKRNINDRRNMMVSSAIGDKDKVSRQENPNWSLLRNLPEHRISSNPYDGTKSTPIVDPEYKLDRNGELISYHTAPGDVNRMVTTVDPEYKLDRNGRLMAVGTNPENKHRLIMDNDPHHELTMNQPNVAYHTAPKGLSAKNISDPQFQLERNGPRVSVDAVRTEGYHQPTHPDRLRDLEPKRGYRAEVGTTPILRVNVPEERDVLGLGDGRTVGKSTRKADRVYSDFNSAGAIMNPNVHMFPLPGLRKRTGVATR